MRSWNQFVAEGLNRPGTQVEIRDHRDHNKESRRLIGDINAELGRCSCCCEFIGDEIVCCYRIVATQEELESD